MHAMESPSLPTEMISNGTRSSGIGQRDSKRTKETEEDDDGIRTNLVQKNVSARPAQPWTTVLKVDYKKSNIKLRESLIWIANMYNINYPSS
jgi:hypothetical protein